ncbi:sensor histidine kinase [Uliginosibacterium sp. H1]|uniref:sensor histidine kinase n=1 Tax=Uliginosibacterium sp. H1 TaxID=3114757 RepID=UPI002E196A0E|nr:ATP-binding protein [Uliginosibacterium sp. H1]
MTAPDPSAPVSPAFCPGDTPLSQVIVTGLLDERPGRPANYQAESAALVQLAQTLADTPSLIAQRLAEAARELTGAHASGISLLDEESEVFRWIATTGEYERYRNGTMPRFFSPCGVVLDRSATLLMRGMVEHYPYINGLHMAPHEVLLVPFFQKGVPVGTVWVVSRDDSKRFDAEDRRLVGSLCTFAAAALQTMGLVDSLQSSNIEQARALKQMHEQVDTLQQLFDHAPAFVALTGGPDHVYEMTNKAYDALIGRDEVLGKTVADVLPEVVPQGFISLLDEVHASGKLYVGRDVAISLHRKGAPPVEVFLDFIYQPMLDEEGRTRAILHHGYDVTERCKAMSSLREADERKDDFIATLAHELRNPIAPIRLSAQVLRLLDKGSDERMHKSLDVIDRQTTQLSLLVESLMDAASIRSGKMVLQCRPVSFQEVFRQALEGSQPQVEARQHQLHVQIPELPMMINGDALRLTQAIMNLLNNAARYTPVGGLITASAAIEHDHIHLHVRDNGIGIAADVLPTIFNMFSQTPAARSLSHAGLGIGLALVQKIAELHGGSIQAHSEGPGKGSEFVLTLPRLP